MQSRIKRLSAAECAGSETRKGEDKGDEQGEFEKEARHGSQTVAASESNTE